MYPCAEAYPLIASNIAGTTKYRRMTFVKDSSLSTLGPHRCESSVWVRGYVHSLREFVPVCRINLQPIRTSIDNLTTIGLCRCREGHQTMAVGAQPKPVHSAGHAARLTMVLQRTGGHARRHPAGRKSLPPKEDLDMEHYCLILQRIVTSPAEHQKLNRTSTPECACVYVSAL